MEAPISVYVIGAPVACADGHKDTWRDIAQHAAGQLRARFGDDVHVQYFDLFDPACPALPADAQLPLVIVEGEVLSSGGKISIPAIRKRIEGLGISPNGH